MHSPCLRKTSLALLLAVTLTPVTTALADVVTVFHECVGECGIPEGEPGCIGSTAVRQTSWGAIKAMYR
jgi:hypothetical protein